MSAPADVGFRIDCYEDHNVMALSGLRWHAEIRMGDDDAVLAHGHGVSAIAAAANAAALASLSASGADL